MQNSRGWSEEDTELLKKYYPIGGTKLCLEKGLNKKPSTIRMRVKYLNIPSRLDVWSDDEIAILHKMYKDKSYSAIASCLEGRSVKSVRLKLEELGLERESKWSDEELELIKEYFPIGGSKLVKQKGVNKKTREISKKANSMGMYLNNRRKFWSEEEVDILRKYYVTEGLDVVKRLKDKNVDNVKNKLNTINAMYMHKYPHWTRGMLLDLMYRKKDKSFNELKSEIGIASDEELKDMLEFIKFKKYESSSYWSNWELDFLKENYEKYSVIELQARGLNRSKLAICKKIKNLGLKGVKKTNLWTDDEVQVLKETYSQMHVNNVCLLLPGKTYKAVLCKASNLGLKSFNSPIEWDAKDLEILKEYYATEGAKGVALRLDKEGIKSRSLNGIYKKASELGLTYKKRKA